MVDLLHGCILEEYKLKDRWGLRVANRGGRWVMVYRIKCIPAYDNSETFLKDLCSIRGGALVTSKTQVDRGRISGPPVIVKYVVGDRCRLIRGCDDVYIWSKGLWNANPILIKGIGSLGCKELPAVTSFYYLFYLLAMWNGPSYWLTYHY